MKLHISLFSLLFLILLQEGLSTHQETCNCNEIGGLINTLEGRLTTTLKELLEPIQRQLNFHLPPPSQLPPTLPPTQPPPTQLGTRDSPAISCKDLLEKYPNTPSGYYWIEQPGSPARVYCSMSDTCGNETGGWMRVANIDVRNTSQPCPRGLTLLTSPRRLCDLATTTGCVSHNVGVRGIQYSKVCGKILAYQRSAPIAFHFGSRGIERGYVYGISLTHGQNPRKHIWTFAGASDETDRQPSFKCPCTNIAVSPPVPSFVGNDYFCSTALSSHYTDFSGPIVHTADPLWDGKGCGHTNTCCSFNTPPWFVKRLSSPTNENIEMRMCRPDTSGTTPFEMVELFVM